MPRHVWWDCPTPNSRIPIRVHLNSLCLGSVLFVSQWVSQKDRETDHAKSPPTNCLHFAGYQIPDYKSRIMLPTGVKKKTQKSAGLEPWFSTLLKFSENRLCYRRFLPGSFMKPAGFFFLWCSWRQPFFRFWFFFLKNKNPWFFDSKFKKKKFRPISYLKNKIIARHSGHNH